MSMREITEEEYVRLNQLSAFANSMMQNPEAAKKLEEAAKLVNPNVRTPRLDEEARIAKPLATIQESIAKLNERLDAEKQARENEHIVAEAARQRADGIAKLRARGYNDSGIAEIEKLMTEKGIIDPLDAETLFVARHPQPPMAKPGAIGGLNMAELIHGGEKTDAHIDNMLKSGNNDRALDVIGDQFALDVLKDLRSAA